MKGVRFLALSFPFILLGPSLHFWLGPSAPLVWKIFAFMLMGVGVFYAVKGLLTILNGFFDAEEEKGNEK